MGSPEADLFGKNNNNIIWKILEPFHLTLDGGLLEQPRPKKGEAKVKRKGGRGFPMAHTRTGVMWEYQPPPRGQSTEDYGFRPGNTVNGTFVIARQ